MKQKEPLAPHAHTPATTGNPLEQARQAQLRRTFAPSLIVLCLVFLGLLFGLSKYTRFAEDPAGQIEQYYQWVSNGTGILVSMRLAWTVAWVISSVIGGGSQQEPWQLWAFPVHSQSWWDARLMFSFCFCCCHVFEQRIWPLFDTKSGTARCCGCCALVTPPHALALAVKADGCQAAHRQTSSRDRLCFISAIR